MADPIGVLITPTPLAWGASSSTNLMQRKTEEIIFMLHLKVNLYQFEVFLTRLICQLFLCIHMYFHQFQYGEKLHLLYFS